MFSALTKFALAPRLWLSAGVFCLGVSIVMEYHEEQMVAQDTLAQKIALPEPVVVQDFSSERHENILNEVHILAEAALDRAVQVDLGSQTSARLVHIVPVYPISRQSFPIVKSITQTPRRPVLRTDAAEVAKQNLALARVETVPVGLLVLEADEANSLGSLSIGAGKNGPLMQITGVRIGATAILEKAEASLAENGVRLIRDSLVVSPYLNGRVGHSEIYDFSGMQQKLFWASAFMIAFGFASLFSLLPSFKKVKKPQTSHQVKAVGAFPAVDPFLPIAGQDELGQESSVSPLRKVSRALTMATETFSSKSRL